MLAGLQKRSGQAFRTRGSSPKFQAFTTALITAQGQARERENPGGRINGDIGGPRKPPPRLTFKGYTTHSSC